MTKTESGRFSRILKKINRASRQMRIAHSGLYRDAFCVKRRFCKWARVNERWESKPWKNKP